ncbi:hypothetical protein [Salinibacter ruber]|uniref:hypothetical protein n=1 Tax=Salinibacter ruber TaxID=146919 RepID=UPI002168392D|nr:hypothetical protein [Salinibacter ruber]
MQLEAREALPQLIEKSEAVKGQGLLQTLLKSACCGPIDLLEFSIEIGEPLFGGLVAGRLVGPLEPGSPGFLVGLREVADDILSFVPLAALHLGQVAEDLIDRPAQVLRAYQRMPSSKLRPRLIRLLSSSSTGSARSVVACVNPITSL